MNIFQINRSDIEDRFDPKYILYLQNIHGFKYEVFLLKRFLIEKPQYGTAEIGLPRTSTQQPRYIRITDINDFGELYDSLGATAGNCSDEYFLYENDLLFARSGATVGKTYLHKHLSYPAFFAGYMIRVRLDESTLLPDYLFAYTQTSFYKNWVDAIQRAAAQPNINAEEYASLPIPLPPLSVQQTIVDLYTNAQNQRKRKLEESQKLLVGLNDYLLSELGIKLPKKDNSLSKRIFVTKFSELTSNRFDPKYILYLKDIHNFKYDIFPLKRFLIEKPQYGTAEIGIPRIKEQQPRYIRITDINDFGELDDSLGATAENCSDEYFLYENDLLFARSGATVGKTYLHKHLSYPAFFAGYMIRVRLDESTLLPDYLFAYTQTSFYKNWVDAIQRAAAQPNINAEEYASLPIPLPPIEKQIEIAKHIQEIRNHAKQLKNEADMILQEAKQKVERMILGDE